LFTFSVLPNWNFKTQIKTQTQKCTFKEIIVEMQLQCFKHTNSKKMLLNEMQMCKEETQKSPSQNANMQRANAKQ
jgi:hypothetical protein